MGEFLLLRLLYPQLTCCSDKIAIMKQGRIASVGSSIRLKNRFGTGYRISVIAETPSDVGKIQCMNTLSPHLLLLPEVTFSAFVDKSFKENAKASKSSASTDTENETVR